MSYVVKEFVAFFAKISIAAIMISQGVDPTVSFFAGLTATQLAGEGISSLIKGIPFERKKGMLKKLDSLIESKICEFFKDRVSKECRKELKELFTTESLLKIINAENCDELMFNQIGAVLKNHRFFDKDRNINVRKLGQELTIMLHQAIRSDQDFLMLDLHTKIQFLIRQYEILQRFQGKEFLEIKNKLDKMNQLIGLNPELIDVGFLAKYQNYSEKEIQKAELSYYRITDDPKICRIVVLSDLDEPNRSLIDASLRTLISNDFLVITGNGGTGKTSAMLRLAIELARELKPVLWIKLDNCNGKADAVSKIIIELCDEIAEAYGEPVVLFIDNPFANQGVFEELCSQRNENSKMVVTERIDRLSILIDETTGFWCDDARFLIVSSADDEYDWLPGDHYEIISIPYNWQEKVLLRMVDTLVRNYNADRDLLNSEIRANLHQPQISLVEMMDGTVAHYNRYRKTIPLDWDEWDMLLKRRFPNASGGSFAGIAALYLFRIPTTLDVLAKLTKLDPFELHQYLSARFKKGLTEPLSYQDKNIYLKHDTVAERYWKHHDGQVHDFLLLLMDSFDETTILNFEKVVFSKKYITGKIVAPFDIRPSIFLRIYQESPRFLRILEENGRLYSFDLALVWQMAQQGKKEESIMQMELLADKYFNRNFLNEYSSICGIDKAIKRIESRQTELSSEHIQLLVKYGKIKKKHDFFTMRRILEILLTVNEKYGKVISPYQEGAILLQINRPAEAEQVYISSLNKDPTKKMLWSALGRLYANTHRSREAEEVYQRALSIDKDQIPVLYELGRLYVNTQRTKEAEEVFLRALAVKDNIPVLYELGRLYANTKRSKEAEDVFQRALSIYKDNIPVLNELGRLYAETQRHKEAEDVFQRALSIDKDNIPVLNELGRLYAKTQRHKEAEDVFQRALSIDKDQIPVLNELGRLYAKTQRHKEAEDVFQRALSIDKDNIPVLNELGRLYAKTQRHKEAEDVYQQVLSIDKDNIPVLNELGRLLVRQREFQQALHIFTHITILDPTDVIAIFELGKVCKKQGYDSAAIKQFSYVLMRQPSDSRALEHLFFVYFDKHDYENAEKVLLENKHNFTKNKYYHRCCYKLYKAIGDTNNRMISERILKDIDRGYII